MFPPPLPAAARRATAADRAPAAAPPRLRVGAGAEGPDRTGPDRTEPNRTGRGRVRGGPCGSHRERALDTCPFFPKMTGSHPPPVA